MKIIRSSQEMQRTAERLRSEGKRLGLVPTMGFLHEGHLSLVRTIRSSCDSLIMSIFVNPAQFGSGEDYEQYPRDFDRDASLAEEAGVDIIFVPSVDEIYGKEYLTYISVEKITDVMCGKYRPGHFRGVTTIVAQLFNICKPHLAVFGRKDFQQAIVIKRMVKDLKFDIDIIISPIIRESDGLAMSSRNVYLSPEERKDAAVLYKALKLAEQLIRDGEISTKKIGTIMKRMFLSCPHVRLQYLYFCNPDTLEEISTISGSVVIGLAAHVGETRLIDNIEVSLE